MAADMAIGSGMKKEKRNASSFDSVLIFVDERKFLSLYVEEKNIMEISHLLKGDIALKIFSNC